MKKQIKASLTISAALLAMAGIAQAAPVELNIYGASAQYTYWNAQAANYAQTRLGCPAGNIVGPVNNGGKHGFVSATGCTSSLVPGGSIEIRYSGIASAEGPLSASKQAPLDATLLTSSTGACDPAKGERAMYASASTTVCKTVHVGTSDVAGESLIQYSFGQKFGPLGGGDFEVNLTGVDTTGLTPHNTVVVPFGFFVNAGVTATKCTAGLIGNYATAASQCDTVPSKGDGAIGAATTIDNISREEAVLIFSGQATNWSDLGSYFTAKPIVACLRHAGSGTHSTLDLAVMNAGWGSNVAQFEAPGNIWFNQGSGDEIKCINGATTAVPAGQLNGAIGYADADQAVYKDKNGVDVANAQNVRQLKYNGVYPTRTAIRNGLYDFYSNAWLYTNGTNAALTTDLIAYASIPANVPSSKANYWATVSEMKFNKTSDTAYPGFVGASLPQLP